MIRGRDKGRKTIFQDILQMFWGGRALNCRSLTCVQCPKVHDRSGNPGLKEYLTIYRHISCTLIEKTYYMCYPINNWVLLLVPMIKGAESVEI